VVSLLILQDDRMARNKAGIPLVYLLADERGQGASAVGDLVKAVGQDPCDGIFCPIGAFLFSFSG
jgi:hypothetical protein